MTNKRKPKILVVDDEKMVLAVMERVLKASLPCEVLTAGDGVTALKKLEQSKVDVVISDVSMPGMDGTELLQTVHELYPDTVRLIFSARSGGEAALRAIGSTHQYFMKPVSASVLSERIMGMLNFQAMLPAEGIENIVSALDFLPSIPDVYTELQGELKKPNVSLENIGRIFEKDLSMSAKVLHLVNSAFFGLRETVTRPAQAVTLLGLNTVKALFVGLHVFEGLQEYASLGFSPQALWKHCMHVASGSREIASVMGLNQEAAGEIYCAGLFHDIGRLVISSSLPKSLIQIDKLRKTGRSWPEAEREILGATHAEIGAYLMALWGFPDPVVRAIAFHHNPSASGSNGFSPVLAVHVANCYCRDGSDRDEKVPMDTEFIREQGMEDSLKTWKSALKAWA